MCTAVKLDYNGGSTIGRTMDFEAPVRFNSVYVPRNYHLLSDARGNAYKTKYSVIGVVFEGEKAIKDGVNEFGLAGVTNMFTGFGLFANYKDDEKLNLSSLDFQGYILANYRSVLEIENDIENIRLVKNNKDGKKIFSPDFHYMFTDPSGRAIVLEPCKGDVKVYENKVNVLTNSPSFPSMIKKMDKFYLDTSLKKFAGARNLPGSFDPVSRFIKAYDYVYMYPESKNYLEAVSGTFNILDALVMPKGFVPNKNYNYYTFTRYICVYDTSKRKLYLKNYKNPAVYELGFTDIVDKNKWQEFHMDFSLKTRKFRGDYEED